ncbi:hypothetical protein [Georgenia halophila]
MRLTVVLLLLVATAATVDALNGPPPYTVTHDVGPWVELPPPPEPWPGGGGGCTVPDPTGSEGCVTPATAWLIEQLRPAFGDAPITCWSEHSWNPDSDHPDGRGCDLFYGTAGEFASGPDLLAGWTAAQWLRVNADALHVHYVIWQGRIWQSGHPELGWAPYDGGGAYDPDDATGGHYDHVHVSVREN